MSDKLEALVAELNKKHKTKIITRATELKPMEFIPYASPKMNWLTRGGVPLKKMTMYAGPGSSGKTTTALDALAQFQKMFPDALAVYLDAENTLDKRWGETLGVDWSKVILIQPDDQCGEELLDMALDALRSGQVLFFVLDSVPFLIPRASYEEGMDKKSYGGNSALMTMFCGKLIPLMHKHGVTTIIVNQVRDDFNAQHPTIKLPGGKMLYHACTQVWLFSKGKLLDADGREQANSFEAPAGHVVRVRMDKNKATPNDRRLGDYTLNYQSGVDVFQDTIDVALNQGLIRQGGAWFYVPVDGEEKKFQGRPALVDFLRSDAGVYEALAGLAYQAVL